MVRPMETPTPNPQKPSIVLKNPIFFSLILETTKQTLIISSQKNYRRICKDKKFFFKSPSLFLGSNTNYYVLLWWWLIIILEQDNQKTGLSLVSLLWENRRKDLRGKNIVLRGVMERTPWLLKHDGNYILVLVYSNYFNLILSVWPFLLFILCFSGISSMFIY